MERDPLNPFQPYEGFPANHENQLTRALLILIKSCPIAHATWLRFVDAELKLSELAPAEFDTQKRKIPIADGDEVPTLVSVFLTPEQPLTTGIVQENDRSQVLDAIIDYQGQPVVIVENKIVGDDVIDQAEKLNTGQKVDFKEGQTAIIVLWRDLLEDFSGLLEKDLVGGGERQMLQDFLTYVENHFETLGPYRRLSLCERNPLRIRRRLRSVLADATGAEATIDSHGPTVDFGGQSSVAARAYFQFHEDEETTNLAVYPADTLSQAQALYPRQDLVEGLVNLARGDAWRLRSNFHFGHMSSGFCWTETSIGCSEYVAYWCERIGETRQVPVSDWVKYVNGLIADGIMNERDRPEFDKRFTNTQRQSATPRPGLELERIWTLREAEDLDRRGNFVQEVSRALSTIKSTLNLA